MATANSSTTWCARKAWALVAVITLVKSSYHCGNSAGGTVQEQYRFSVHWWVLCVLMVERMSNAPFWSQPQLEHKDHLFHHSRKNPSGYSVSCPSMLSPLPYLERVFKIKAPKRSLAIGKIHTFVHSIDWDFLEKEQAVPLF